MDISSEANQCQENNSGEQVTVTEQSLSVSSSSSTIVEILSSQSEEKEVEGHDRKRKKTDLSRLDPWMMIVRRSQ